DGVALTEERLREIVAELLVKPGHAKVRDLKGTVEREKAAILLFVTLDDPSKEMRLEADTAGLSIRKSGSATTRRSRIRTFAQLLPGLKPQLPPFVMPTYQQAQRVHAPAGEQADMFDKQAG